MREYNRDDRNRDRDYSRDETREFRDEESLAERETPRENMFKKPAAVRVTLKKKYNDPMKNFKEMLQEFKRRVSNAGVMHDFKDHQFYESKSEIKRKTLRASAKKLLMEGIEKKIISGEKPIRASAGMIKKVLANMREKELKKKEKEQKKKERQSRYNDD